MLSQMPIQLNQNPAAGLWTSEKRRIVSQFACPQRLNGFPRLLETLCKHYYDLVLRARLHFGL